MAELSVRKAAAVSVRKAAYVSVRKTRFDRYKSRSMRLPAKWHYDKIIGQLHAMWKSEVVI